jgi:hypothetical protein
MTDRWTRYTVTPLTRVHPAMTVGDGLLSIT